MPTCQIEEFIDTAESRAELIPWLVATEPEPITREIWTRRLCHWWDMNPFSSECPERGWVMRYEGKVVGFMALIPACYGVDGKPTPAYIASTWRVDEPHRNASLPMLMKLRRISTSYLIADTTPIPEVQIMLSRMGWIPRIDIQRRFVILGLIGKGLVRRSWPKLPPNLRVTFDLAEVRSVHASVQASKSIEKWITPDYLRWFASSVMRKHVFIGLVDSSGCLSSYLFLMQTKIRGIPGWMELDHFSTAHSQEELYALVGEIVRRPSLLGGRRILSLASFPGDATWEDAPCLHKRTEQVRHFFSIPTPLKDYSKRTVLAEGDWGF
jgi:hypothetical protein